MAILEDKGNFVSTTGGTVTLQLGELVTALGQQLGLPSGVIDRIPPDAGNIVIAKSDQLAAAQNGVKAVKWMGILLGIVVIALYGLAVYLAKGRRRRTFRNIGWAVIAVGLFLAITRRVTGNYVMSMLSDPTLRPAVKAVYTIGSQLLVDLAWTIFIWGLVIVVGCFLAGPTRPAVWVRRTIAPVLNLRWEAVAIGAVAIYLILLLWAPVPALQTWPSALGLAVVLGLGLWALRRRTLVEFPDAELGGAVSGARDKLGSAWGSVTSSVKGIGGGGGGAATTTPASSSASPSCTTAASWTTPSSPRPRPSCSPADPRRTIPTSSRRTIAGSDRFTREGSSAGAEALHPDRRGLDAGRHEQHRGVLHEATRAAQVHRRARIDRAQVGGRESPRRPVRRRAAPTSCTTTVTSGPVSSSA